MSSNQQNSEIDNKIDPTNQSKDTTVGCTISTSNSMNNMESKGITNSTEKQYALEENLLNLNPLILDNESSDNKESTEANAALGRTIDSSDESEDSESDSDTESSTEDESDDEEIQKGPSLSDKSESQNSQTLIQEVDKLTITPSQKSPAKKDSGVILNKPTDSLRNLLAYDNSSDDSDFEKNWQLHELRHIACNNVNDDGSEDDSDSSCTSLNENDDGPVSTKTGATSKKPVQYVDICEDDYNPPLPDISQLKINVEKEEFLHIGFVASIIDKLVTIDTVKGTPAFDLDSYLFIEQQDNKLLLGPIFDVLGPISAPMYVVRFKSTDDISKMGVTKGMKVFAAHKSEYSKYVFVKQLLRVKGSDASWRGDQEVPPEMAEFSDDDEERQQAKEKRHMKRKHASEDQYHEYEQIMNQCNIINTRACHLADQHQQKRNTKAPRNTQTSPMQVHSQPQPYLPAYIPGFNPSVPPPYLPQQGQNFGYNVGQSAHLFQNWALGYANVAQPNTNWNNANYQNHCPPGPSSQR